MNNIMSNKKIVIFCFVLIFIFLVISLLINNNVFVQEEEFKYEENVIEKYGVNQYIPTYVTKQEMANKYLNDYKNILRTNVGEAYNLLNKEYREKKYSSYENFEEIIKNKYSLSFYSMIVEKYSVETINGNRVYFVYTSNDDMYIFKEKSIMNYEVYLDEYTVEIK